jgi:hypothetical protein
MKAFKIKTLLGTLAVLLLLPAMPVSAYEATGATATRLNDEYSLLTVTYRFGFLNREALIPMDARLGGVPKDYSVGYALVDMKGATVPVVDAKAVVLSTAELRGREYYIPRGKNADFTLVAIVRTTKNTDLGLAITRLPFTMIDGDIAVRASAPGDKLGEYKTPLLSAQASPSGK